MTIFASSLVDEKMLEVIDNLFSKIIGFGMPLQNQGIMNSNYLTKVEEMKTHYLENFFVSIFGNSNSCNV